MGEIIDKIYGNRVRLRVCGLCWRDNALLMVNHSHISSGNFWAPPGGGVEFGQTVEETLIREFFEETGIHIAVGEFRFCCEFVQPPLHAMELFFSTNLISGNPKPGYDPEHGNDQIISEIGFIEFNEIQELPSQERHGIFQHFKTVDAFKKATGFWKI